MLLSQVIFLKYHFYHYYFPAQEFKIALNFIKPSFLTFIALHNLTLFKLSLSQFTTVEVVSLNLRLLYSFAGALEWPVCLQISKPNLPSRPMQLKTYLFSKVFSERVLLLGIPIALAIAIVK